MLTASKNIHHLFKNIDSEMELLLALGEHVNKELDIDALLQIIAESAQNVIDAKTLVVPIIDFKNKEYKYFAASGENAQLIKGQSFPLHMGMCGWVLSNKEPLIFAKNYDLPFGKKTVWEQGMESALLVPLISRGKIIGGLSGLGKSHGKSYTKRDLEFLTLFANQTSVAVENAQIIHELNNKKFELEELLHITRFEKELAEVTIESIADAVVITDPKGKILNLNPSSEKILAVKSRDAIGKPINKVVTLTGWEQDSNNYPLFEALIEDHQVKISQASLISTENKEYTVDGTVSIMRNEHYQAIGAVMLLHDITEHHQMVNQIHHYATYDQLTGLINRREFELRLASTIDNAKKLSTTHALCYMDLDQFKIINDTCGHAVGDELLRQLSSTLKKSIRERDTLSRIGGDEFGLLLENCALENAIKIAETLRQEVEDFYFHSNEQVYRVGISIGLVVINSSSPTLNELLISADQACYMAKELGRNQVKIFTDSDEELLSRKYEMHWVSELHEALTHNYFELYYQPIISTQNTVSDQSDYYEILIRLPDKNGSIRAPGAFLPAAERYGLMISIDRWVVSNYLSWLSKNKKHLKKLKKCSINLSAQSLSDNNLLIFIEEQLNKYKIPANKLCFEITETAVIANISEALLFIDSMKKKGTGFSIDDFGTGMSSFSYLKKLPVDNIKIDGAFIKDILNDDVDEALVRNMVEISKVLGKSTIAEFVESEEILKKIKQIGIDYAQGYGIAKPQPLSNILR